MLPLTRINLTDTDIASYSRVIPASLVVASRTAQHIIQQAQDVANQIKKDADIHYQEKSKQGYQDGQTLWEQHKAEQVSQLNIDIQQHVSGLHNTLKSTVIDATEKLIGSIEKDELLNGLVNQAINQLTNQCVFNLRVSPENVDLAKRITQSILAGNAGMEGFNIVIDPSLSPSDYLLEHADGSQDISVHTQLERLENVIS